MGSMVAAINRAERKESRVDLVMAGGFFFGAELPQTLEKLMLFQ